MTNTRLGLKLLLLTSLIFGIYISVKGANYSTVISAPMPRSANCSANSDAHYNRKTMLVELAQILNKSYPSWKKEDPEHLGFHVENESPAHFFVIDLTEPSNRSTPTKGCVRFVDKHIYHFASVFFSDSLSHIALLENGDMKIFRAINCKNSGDNIDEVVKYVRERLKISEKDKRIKRLKEYRKYGDYIIADVNQVNCSMFEKEDYTP